MKRSKRTNYNDLENMDHAEKKFYGDQMKEMGCKGFVLRDIWDVLGPYLLIIVAVISLLVGILIGWSWRASRDGGALSVENSPEQATDTALTTEYRAEIPPEGTTPVQTDARQTTPVIRGEDSPTAPVTTVPEEDQTEGLPNEPETRTIPPRHAPPPGRIPPGIMIRAMMSRMRMMTSRHRYRPAPDRRLPGKPRPGAQLRQRRSRRSYAPPQPRFGRSRRLLPPQRLRHRCSRDCMCPCPRADPLPGWAAATAPPSGSG